MGGRPSGRLCEVLEMTMTEASKGWINGFIGMALFSGSLPATRVAVLDKGVGFQIQSAQFIRCN